MMKSEHEVDVKSTEKNKPRTPLDLEESIQTETEGLRNEACVNNEMIVQPQYLQFTTDETGRIA